MAPAQGEAAPRLQKERCRPGGVSWGVPASPWLLLPGVCREVQLLCLEPHSEALAESLLKGWGSRSLLRRRAGEPRSVTVWARWWRPTLRLLRLQASHLILGETSRGGVDIQRHALLPKTSFPALKWGQYCKKAWHSNMASGVAAKKTNQKKPPNKHINENSKKRNIL